MARLINADALGIGRANRDVFKTPEYADGWNSAFEIIETAPTVDAVAVVRCKDCKYSFCDFGTCCRNFGGMEVSEDWYCADGERKGGDE